MASVQRKLVHKQFNSPIGLYSDNNVKATLDRELKVLSNGTMGIDFDDISKPANLANSAVLRMLEEEENQKRHGRQPGGLKRVAWPPEQEYQSPSGVAQQPQQSPAQGNTHHQSSQNQYPSQYNNNARQPSHETSAVQQRSPYQQEQTNYPQPIYQQQHSQSYPTQQTQPSYQPQSYNGHQSAPVDNHPQPVYQRQHSQSQARQIRATPARVFPNPDPSFMHINRPSHLQPPQPTRTVSPSTTAFAGGVAVNAPQQSQYQSPGYANSAGASPQYQPQSSPNYQQQSSPSHYQQPQSSPQYQPQSSPQYQPSPQYQSNSSLPLSPDPNISLPGWSPVRKPVQVNTGYTLNNQRPSAEPYSGQSYAGNQNQYQQQTSPSYQPSTNYNQYQPQQAPQQQQQPQYQPQQQQQYQSTPSNEHQYQAQQPYYRQPSPGIITLRKEAPFNQEPAPVFTSSPSAASFGGGTNMRGDQKWPPQEYKLQSEIDNEARRRLAQGPVLRPRRVQKDYSQFFNQHALNSTYPAYRAPPGTQHYPAH